MVRVNLFLIIFAGTLLLLGNCSQQDISESSLQIDNGFSLNSQAKNRVDGVVLIHNANKDNYCSGSIVSTNTVLLAGHCAFDDTMDRQLFNPNTNEVSAKMCIIDGPYQGKCAIKIVKMPQTDIAILKFEDGLFRHIFRVSNANLQQGTDVLMVGFSKKLNSNSPWTIPDGESKKWGRNRIASVDGNGFLTSQSDGTPNAVAINTHDSGGPMLHQCQVGGVASSRVDNNQTIQSTHVAVNQLPISNWLQSMTQSLGIHVCRENDVDPLFCPANLIYNFENNPAPESATQPGFPCTMRGGIHVLVVKLTGQQAKPDDHQFYFSASAQGAKVGLCENIKPEICAGSANAFTATPRYDIGSPVPVYKVPFSRQLTRSDPKRFWSFVVLDGQNRILQSRTVSIFQQ